MAKWSSFLGVSGAMCLLIGGCGMTAGDIAAGQGTLGTGWFYRESQKRLVQMIESGEADKMVADGKTQRKTYEKGLGDRAILVTEHRVQGMLYRVEVRNRVNPAMDVLTTNVRQVNYGPPDRSLQTVNPVERADVLRTIANNSFDGQGQVAYRAYVGSDGTFHPVRVMPGEVPDWSDRSGIDLVLRTDVWAAGMMHFRGCRPDGTDRNGRLMEPDGRWVVMTEGSAVPMTKCFYNRDLHKVMKTIAFVQAYNTDLLRVP
jgi:hypothetical protein